MAYGAVRPIAEWPRTDWRALRGTLGRIIASPYTIPALVFVGFWALNVGIGGPAYTSDEIGYLDKAATIAGSPVHLTTSWFGGYSFMIAPAFLFAHDPYSEWNLILVLNALMWAGSAALLQYILRTTHPQTSARAVFWATAGAMLYPSWLSMSGYAFATSGFVLVFLAALAAIIKSEFRSVRWLCAAGALAGYLFWTHPLGGLFLGLFVLVLIAQAWLQKRWVPLLAAAGSSLVALAYLLIVEPWLNHAMSGSSDNDNHYITGLSGLLHALTTIKYWQHFGGLLAGTLFSVIVATFGLVLYGALPVLRELRNNRRNQRIVLQDARVVVLALPVLLVAAVIALNAFLGAVNAQPRIDQWVYGRYADMFLLPLIGYGLLASWKWRPALRIAGVVLATGILLSIFTNPHNTMFAFDNKVNIQGLWPMQLASIVHANYYWLWGLMGACGVAVCGFMGIDARKRYLPLLLAPVVLTWGGNYLYHRTVAQAQGSVSSLYQYIRANYTASDCIGFTPVPDSNGRFAVYSYYLHGYDLEKMSLQQWQQQKCTGPYLTYDSGAVATLPGLQVTGEETSTQLYMLTRPDKGIATGRPQANLSASGDSTTSPIIFY